MQQQQYVRTPLRYVVQVDGRTIGEDYSNRWEAREEAELIKDRAPWSCVEVIKFH